MRRTCLPLPFALAAALTAQSNWIMRPPTGLGSRYGSVMAYDGARNLTVLFGGVSSQGREVDTWLYDGAAWRQQLGAGGPTYYPAPSSATLAAAFDSARGVTVLTDGWGFRTYEFDGAQWTLVDTMPALQGRIDYALAYDSVRHVVVLFGGTYANNNFGYCDTWEWNGTSWTQVGTGGPHTRYGQAMAFDGQRGVTVLFGGLSNTGFSGNNVLRFGDTWEWDGSYWYEHYGVSGPSPRSGASMTYDSRRHRTLLFGGADSLGSRNDTWEWDGMTWQQVTTAAAPPAGSQRPLVFDQRRGVAVVHSDLVGTDAWELLSLPPSPASYTAFGQGCGGPGGTPVLAAATGSLPRLGSTFTAALSGLPASPFNLPFGVLGFDATAWNGVPLPVSLDPLGFTGCQAWIAPVVSSVLVNAGGTASWSLAVPVAIQLAGVEFYLQGAVLVPGWNPGGLIFSNAGHAVIGAP